MDRSNMGSMPSWQPLTGWRQPPHRALTLPLAAPSKTTQEVQMDISAFRWKTLAPPMSVMPLEPSGTRKNAPKKKKTPGGVTKTRKKTTSRQRLTKSLELTLDQGGVPPPKNNLLSPRSMA